LSAALIACIPIAYALGWAFGYGKGRAKYADLVGEQRGRIDHFAAEVKALEFEIMALSAATPDVDHAGRVLDILSKPHLLSDET
jgi:hypothetical protein